MGARRGRLRGGRRRAPPAGGRPLRLPDMGRDRACRVRRAGPGAAARGATPERALHGAVAGRCRTTPFVRGSARRRRVLLDRRAARGRGRPRRRRGGSAARMKSTELKRAKRQTRRAVLEVRDAVAVDAREERGERVVERFLDLPEVRRARTVLLFWAFGSEVPTGALIRRLHERGVVVGLPRIEGADLVPVSYVPGDPTTPTTFGAEEPAGG